MHRLCVVCQYTPQAAVRLCGAPTAGAQAIPEGGGCGTPGASASRASMIPVGGCDLPVAATSILRSMLGSGGVGILEAVSAWSTTVLSKDT